MYIVFSAFRKKVNVKGEMEWTWIQWMDVFIFGFGHCDHQFSSLSNFDP